MIFIQNQSFDAAQYDTVFFDLDGTLTQSGIGITRAGAYALSQFGIEKQPHELTHLIGPPLEKEFMNVYGFSQTDAAEAVRLFRVYYLDRGWKENAPYDGIEKALTLLKQQGKRLAVATSKPEETAVRILNYFDLAPYFDLICGPSMKGPEHEGKAVIIRDAFRRLSITDPSHTVMVGDRKHDILGAHEAGILAIGVLYGYGSREELEAANADVLADTVSDIPFIFQ